MDYQVGGATLGLARAGGGGEGSLAGCALWTLWRLGSGGHGQSQPNLNPQSKPVPGVHMGKCDEWRGANPQRSLTRELRLCWSKPPRVLCLAPDFLKEEGPGESIKRQGATPPKQIPTVKIRASDESWGGGLGVFF